jgi:GNAT superfamily N-acetyltransferase
MNRRISPHEPAEGCTATGPDFAIRCAARADLQAIHAMIGELAEFERLTHLFVASEEQLDAALFGPRPAAEVLIATKQGAIAGFALYFPSFSTFLGRPGLWLEDLFVRPAFRRQGCGRALLRSLASIALQRGCGRFEWAVLDWNSRAIQFYRQLGASVLPDWRIVRVTGEALATLGAGSPGVSEDMSAAARAPELAAAKA